MTDLTNTETNNMTEDEETSADEVPMINVRHVLCRIKEADYMEASEEKTDDNEVSRLANKILLVCEEVESGVTGGGTMTSEDIARITDTERTMTPREMMDFADNLRNYSGIFMVSIPDKGAIPISVPLEVEEKTDTNDAYLPLPLSPEEESRQTEVSSATKQSIGEKFAARRRQIIKKN